MQIAQKALFGETRKSTIGNINDLLSSISEEAEQRSAIEKLISERQGQLFLDEQNRMFKINPGPLWESVTTNTMFINGNGVSVNISPEITSSVVTTTNNPYMESERQRFREQLKEKYP